MDIETNPVKWSAQERQEFLDNGFRTRRENEFPPVSAFARPADYTHDLKRGAIPFSPEWRNYAYHSVVIPDDTTVRNCNFSQCEPQTAAITGKNLTLIDCNLVNVALDPTWRLENSNTAQAWLVSTAEGEKRQFICSHPDQLKAQDVQSKPANVVTSREF